MSWIHIDDLVRLLIFAAESSGVEGALNGASPNPVTNAEFTRTLSGVLRRPAPWTIPQFALKAAFGEMAEVLLDSARVLPVAAEEAGFQFEYPDLRKALEECLSKR
jgi:NAD dependent epimerase/dehydratase family enzyme